MAEQQGRPRRKVEGYTISAVAERYGVHPQTLRMYEREGLVKPFRSVGNTRYYNDRDCERLEMILTLTRDMGVNLAGVEVILNLREQYARMQDEMTQFLEAVRSELSDRIRDREEHTGAALVPRAGLLAVTRTTITARSRTRRTEIQKKGGDRNT